MTDILDARGVPITAGDTVIWGFGVSRSVAMAEGVVLAEKDGYPYPAQTPTGRIKVKVVRRSYSSSEKPVVDIGKDRLIVLKAGAYGPGKPYLPPSPLPTQAEKARKKIQQRMDVYKKDLLSTDVSWGPFETVAEMHVYASERLAELRRKLKALDE